MFFLQIKGQNISVWKLSPPTSLKISNSLSLTYILAEKRNASINSGVVFLKKIVDFI